MELVWFPESPLGKKLLGELQVPQQSSQERETSLCCIKSQRLQD